VGVVPREPGTRGRRKRIVVIGRIWLVTGTSETGIGPDSPGIAFSLKPGPGLKSAKLALLRTAARGGVLRALRDSRWRGKRLLILAYHGISLRDEHEWSPELYIPVDAMRERFAMMRDAGYHVLSLREGLARLTSGSLPPRAVALTFDDGTHDFVVAGVPLLQEFGFPATVYVTTYYAATQTPVFRMATRYLLWAGRDRVIDGTGLTAAGGPLELRTLDQRDAAVEWIERHVASGQRGSQELAMLQRLAGRVGVDLDQFLAERRQRIMSPEEISNLPNDLVEVQLHTHRHTVPLDPDAFRREIEDNRRALAEWRPQGVFDAFCYPSGVTNPRFLPWLRSLGVKSAVTCEPGLASDRTNPLLLPRVVDTFRLTRLEFGSWLTGGGALLPRLPRRERYRPAMGSD
jgi:peptidoglycan/xylan/chitin deacetylase (PgdA/CDA1 family)